MDTEVDDGERREQGVGKHGVPIPIPTSVVVKPREAKPHGEGDADVEGGHAVGERVNPTKPVGDFRREGVSKRFHFGDGIARHSNVEEEVKRYGENVDPSDGEGDSVSEPTVIEIGKIKHGNIANEHETCHVEMGQGRGQPIRLKRLLNPQHQVSFNRPNVRRHVKAGTGHEQTIDLVKAVLGVVDGEDDEDVNPVASEKVNKRRE